MSDRVTRNSATLVGGLSIKNALTVAVFPAIWLTLLSCSSKWETLNVGESGPPERALKINLYEPFDRQQLISDAETAYGPPEQSDFKKEGAGHVAWKEYAGKRGRIRVFEEMYAQEEGQLESTTWLVLYPGPLYLRDVLQDQDAARFTAKEGEWKLSVRPSDHSWSMSFTLDGAAIVMIADHQR